MVEQLADKGGENVLTRIDRDLGTVSSIQESHHESGHVEMPNLDVLYCI